MVIRVCASWIDVVTALMRSRIHCMFKIWLSWIGYTCYYVLVLFRIESGGKSGFDWF